MSSPFVIISQDVALRTVQVLEPRGAVEWRQTEGLLSEAEPPGGTVRLVLTWDQPG